MSYISNPNVRIYNKKYKNLFSDHRIQDAALEALSIHLVNVSSLSPMRCTVLLAFFYNKEMETDLVTQSLVFINLIMSSLFKITNCDTKQWTIWSKDCVFHLCIPFCLPCLVHRNEWHFRQWRDHFFQRQRTGLFPKVQGPHRVCEVLPMWLRSFLRVQRSSAFATCWTLTERTEAKFSQDLILRFGQSSLIGVLLQRNGPKVSGGSVSFWRASLILPIRNKTNKRKNAGHL